MGKGRREEGREKGFDDNEQKIDCSQIREGIRCQIIRVAEILDPSRSFELCAYTSESAEGGYEYSRILGDVFTLGILAQQRSHEYETQLMNSIKRANSIHKGVAKRLHEEIRKLNEEVRTLENNYSFLSDRVIDQGMQLDELRRIYDLIEVATCTDEKAAEIMRLDSTDYARVGKQ